MAPTRAPEENGYSSPTGLSELYGKFKESIAGSHILSYLWPQPQCGIISNKVDTSFHLIWLVCLAHN